MNEELDFHHLELARAEDEVSRRDLVAEPLAELREAERDFDARRVEDIAEIVEHPLSGLGPEVGFALLVPHRSNVGFEHQVELAGLGQLAAALAGPLRRLQRTRGLADLVGAEA